MGRSGDEWERPIRSRTLMGKFDLITFASAGELARAAAAAWLMEIDRAHRAGSVYCVALSGGRIAREFFAAAAGQAKTTGTSMTPVQFFWADERCVPPDDAESNFAMARDLLFTPLDIPERQIHRIRGEAPPDAAAAEAEAEIRGIVPINAGEQPVLDLVVLGMGEDGHVASLFPNEPKTVLTGKPVYRAVTAAKPPSRRITLGYPAIAAARQAWVLASGAGKETALRQSLNATGQTPLAHVLSLRSHTRIFTDIGSG